MSEEQITAAADNVIDYLLEHPDADIRAGVGYEIGMGPPSDAALREGIKAAIRKAFEQD